MAKIVIIYGSTMGNTQSVAEAIESAMSSHEVELLEVANASKDDFEKADLLLLGSSTWGAGDLQDDWECALDTLKEASLSGKKVALFGCGDADSYCDTFADAVGILYETVSEAGANVIGATSTEGYTHTESRAEVNGEFVGLALSDSSSDNDSRIAAWCDALNAQI